MSPQPPVIGLSATSLKALSHPQTMCRTSLPDGRCTAAGAGAVQHVISGTFNAQLCTQLSSLTALHRSINRSGYSGCRPTAVRASCSPAPIGSCCCAQHASDSCRAVHLALTCHCSRRQMSAGYRQQQQQHSKLTYIKVNLQDTRHNITKTYMYEHSSAACRM
jgi:hypothetical protein